MYKTSKNSQILYYDHAKYLNDLRQLLNIYIYSICKLQKNISSIFSTICIH